MWLLLALALYLTAITDGPDGTQITGDDLSPWGRVIQDGGTPYITQDGSVPY